MDTDAAEALKDLGVTENDIYSELGDEINRQLDVKADEVLAYWVSISPEKTGKYVDSIIIEDIEDADGHPARRIVATAPYSHILEYGSEDTTEYAPRAKTATHFGNVGRYTVE